MIPYTLIRSKRKTVTILVTREATLEVRAPQDTPKAEIDRIVLAHREKLEKALEERKRRMENQAAFSLNYGDTVILQGKEYPIIAKAGTHIGFDGRGFYLPPNLPKDQIVYSVIDIYKMIAKNILVDKTMRYAKQMGVIPSAVKVNDAKTHWGSCSSKGSINFSWRLIMADEKVIDYVVVHELAHITEHNHSAKFWAIVASIVPEYKTLQEELKKLQMRHENENWEYF